MTNHLRYFLIEWEIDAITTVFNVLVLKTSHFSIFRKIKFIPAFTCEEKQTTICCCQVGHRCYNVLETERQAISEPVNMIKFRLKGCPFSTTMYVLIHHAMYIHHGLSLIDLVNLYYISVIGKQVVRHINTAPVVHVTTIENNSGVSNTLCRLLILNFKNFCLINNIMDRCQNTSWSV